MMRLMTVVVVSALLFGCIDGDMGVTGTDEAENACSRLASAIESVYAQGAGAKVTVSNPMGATVYPDGSVVVRAHGSTIECSFNPEAFSSTAVLTSDRVEVMNLDGTVVLNNR